MCVSVFDSTNIATHLNELGNYFGKSSSGIIIWSILAACQLFHCFLPVLLTLQKSHKSFLQDTVEYCQQIQIGCSRQTNKAGKVFSFFTQFSKIKDHPPYLPLSRVDTETHCVGVIHQKMNELHSVPSKCDTIVVKRVPEFPLVFIWNLNAVPTH